MASRPQPAGEPDRVRLRRIGLGIVVVLVAALVLSTLVVVGGSDDERGVIVVAPASAPPVDEDQIVRVTGVVRDAVDLGDDERFEDVDPENAVVATRVEPVATAEPRPGDVEVEDINGDEELEGRRVTVVGVVDTVPDPKTFGLRAAD